MQAASIGVPLARIESPSLDLQLRVNEPSVLLLIPSIQRQLFSLFRLIH